VLGGAVVPLDLELPGGVLGQDGNGDVVELAFVLRSPHRVEVLHRGIAAVVRRYRKD
jgi:hypothetical protein